VPRFVVGMGLPVVPCEGAIETKKEGMEDIVNIKHILLGKGYIT
jgi:hypothetical protein